MPLIRPNRPKPTSTPMRNWWSASAHGTGSGSACVITTRYNRRLFRVARSILRDDAEAEDVVQETYVRAFTGLDMFRGDAAFGTWITRIAMLKPLAGCEAAAHGRLGDLRRNSPPGADYRLPCLGGQQRSGENDGARRNPCRS